ncbi:MAG: IS1595 family transposase [Bacteroidia bacterium]
MNLFELQSKYNTHIKCVRHLEKVRRGNTPICAHCEADNVTIRGTRRKFKNKGRIAREYKTPSYHCNSCNRDFTVLSGTIFEASKLPLQKWFALISLMLNARKGVSAMNLMRDLGITYKTAWFSAMRVRCAMLDQAYMLEGIVEMDEAYFGGKPRKRNVPDNVANLGYSGVKTDEWKGGKKKDRRQFNMGRGTKSKVKVVGIVERGEKGRVVMKVQDSLTGADLLKTLKRYVNMADTTVMTDDFKSYKTFDKVIQHYSVNHSKKQYVKYIKGIKDSIHTNTVEGVWSIIKNGIRGQYHVLSKKYLPFYLAEAAYKYNRRDKQGKAEAFDETITNSVNDEKCEVNYKPKAYPKFLAYKRRKKKTCKRKE